MRGRRRAERAVRGSTHSRKRLLLTLTSGANTDHPRPQSLSSKILLLQKQALVHAREEVLVEDADRRSARRSTTSPRLSSTLRWKLTRTLVCCAELADVAGEVASPRSCDSCGSDVSVPRPHRAADDAATAAEDDRCRRRTPPSPPPERPGATIGFVRRRDQPELRPPRSSLAKRTGFRSA